MPGSEPRTRVRPVQPGRPKGGDYKGWRLFRGQPLLGGSWFGLPIIWLRVRVTALSYDVRNVEVVHVNVRGTGKSLRTGYVFRMRAYLQPKGHVSLCRATRCILTKKNCAGTKLPSFLF